MIGLISLKLSQNHVVVTDAIASISKSPSRGMRDTSTNVLAEYFITTLQQWIDGRRTHLVGLWSPKNS
jgi:hypothetical protein